MGHTSYSANERVARATLSGFHTKSVDEIFQQNKKRMIHDSMSPKGITFREARDSATHPDSVPIILTLDVTGSMGMIPHQLIKDGLPKMMSGIIQAGIPDPALLFLAVGDTECDSYPLQVGQFESGDVELDTWLTRTYLEKGGGGNAGESYLLAWYFAAFHTQTDAWDKRKEKGFLFTIGDEPSLDKLPLNVIESLMGSKPQANAYFTDVQLLALAQEKYNVYHLHITETHAGSRSTTAHYWDSLLGQNNIRVDKYSDVASIVATVVSNHAPKRVVANKPATHTSPVSTSSPGEMML